MHHSARHYRSPQLGKALLDVGQMSACPAVHDAADRPVLAEAMLAADCEQALGMIENRRRIAP
jgi:hypothetical protein